MYINNINILYYLFLGIIGLGIGSFVAWSTVRLPDYKKVFVREFFTIYLKNEKPKYIYMVADGTTVCWSFVFVWISNKNISVSSLNTNVN